MTGLPAGQTVYFAERATDDSGNTSLIARTSVGIPPPSSIDASLVPAFKQCGTPGNPTNSVHAPPSLTGGPNHRCHAATPSMLARLSTRDVFVALPR